MVCGPYPEQLPCARAAAACLAARLAVLSGAGKAPAAATTGEPGRCGEGLGLGSQGAAQTSLTVEATKAAIGEFFRQCSTRKGRCENCEALNPTLRRRGPAVHAPVHACLPAV